MNRLILTIERQLEARLSKWRRSIAKRLSGFRTHNPDERYLAASTDHADLERRLRAIDRESCTTSLFVTFNH
jgi:Protein of unknown function (DUF3563)